MFYQELVDYIKKARASGMSEEEMRKELTTAGWGTADINEAFILSGGSNMVFPPSLPRSEQSTQGAAQGAGGEKPRVLIVESKGEIAKSTGRMAYGSEKTPESGGVRSGMQSASPQGVLPRVQLGVSSKSQSAYGKEQSTGDVRPRARKRGLIIGLVVALVLIGGSVGAYVMFFSAPAVPVQEENITPPPPADPTAGWETYRNEEFGFEFKYPNDWVWIQSEGKEPEYLGSIIEKKDLNRETEIPVISLQIYDNKNKFDIRKWWSEVRKIEDEGGQSEGIHEQQIAVSNVTALRIDTTELWVSIPYQSLYIPLSDKVLAITSAFGELSLDQILSTFKFIEPTTDKPCIVTGCSKQICAEEEAVTTCEFKEEYACYKTATCARQADGACGWTTTAALTSCLEAAR